MTDLPLSACVELLFAEGSPPFPDRIRAAAAAGCDGIEFWEWRHKPLEAIAEAVAETGVAVTMMVVEPRSRLVDPSTLPEFLAGVRDSAAAAARIGCRAVVALSGTTLDDASAADQNDAIVAALQAAAPIAAEHGVLLLLEPLNSRIDHPGEYLSGTTLGLNLVERVDRPGVALLHDVYHSAIMGERPVEVLAGRGELVGHVHVADTEGRHEPGTGAIDWPHVVSGLRAIGYRGFVGLEYAPTVDSAQSMRFLRGAIAGQN